eukprot:157849_1
MNKLVLGRLTFGRRIMKSSLRRDVISIQRRNRAPYTKYGSYILWHKGDGVRMDAGKPDWAFVKLFGRWIPICIAMCYGTVRLNGIGPFVADYYGDTEEEEAELRALEAEMIASGEFVLPVVERQGRNLDPMDPEEYPPKTIM